jgi:glycine/D-amino acid oxidase-like deaminating enzyme
LGARKPGKSEEKVRTHDVDIIVVGAGIVGIAAAYFLATRQKRTRLLVVDSGQPMTLTSAQSGENYRNWWPHPIMTAFTDHSIGLMEEIARRTDNRIHMTRRGYLLATRNPADRLIEQLYEGYGDAAERSIRMHDGNGATQYQPPRSADWQSAPLGVDVLLDRTLIRETYPYLDPEIAAILHIRRAGDISGQQLGQFMLEELRALGGRFLQADVRSIAKGSRFAVEVDLAGERETVNADVVVNAAGPYAAQVAMLHGESLPLLNVLQQKVAFPDKQAALSRQMPFAIDLDGQSIAWTAEEREALASDPALARLLAPMPGNIHCRPDGGEGGQWIKLGWAFNATPSEPTREPQLDDNFPEVVLRAVCRMLPALKCYLGTLPRERSHYGGFYPMTAENWPLIGATRTPGAFVVGALSGYGTMSACAAGDLVARCVAGAELPSFARPLSLARYEDHALMSALQNTASRGLL